MILLPNFARSLKVAEENRELAPQELQLFLAYARHLGFKTSIRNRKRQLQNFLAEATAYGTWKALNISYGSTRQWRLNFQSSKAKALMAIKP